MGTLAVKDRSNTKQKQGELNRAVIQPSHRSPNSEVLQRKASCACGGGCPRCQEKLGIQTKLRISEPGDQYEQEADRMADQVMRTPEPSVQRQVEPEEEEEEMVQRQAIANQIAPLNQKQESFEVPPIVHEVLSSPGQPLDSVTRAFMEARLGYDFSPVQIHNNAQAAESAQVVQALAYTVGQKIVFGAGKYAPNTKQGKQLLAHELAHVIQQSSLKISRPKNEQELEADYIAKQSRQIPELTLQRQAIEDIAIEAATSLSAPGVPRGVIKEAMSNLIISIKKFFECMFGELSKVNLPDLRDLQASLLANPFVLHQFPSIFIAGVLKGIVEDLEESLSALGDLIENPEIILKGIEAIKALLFATFTSEGKEVACALGGDIGENFATEISSLSNRDLIEFAFELGKLAGPAIFAVALSVMGIGLMTTSVKVVSKFSRLAKVLAKFPKLQAILPQIKVKNPQKTEGSKPIKPDKLEDRQRTLPQSLHGCRFGSLDCNLKILNNPKFSQHLRSRNEYEDYIGDLNFPHNFELIIRSSPRQGGRIPSGNDAYIRYLQEISDKERTPAFLNKMHEIERLPRARRDIDFREIRVKGQISRWPLDHIDRKPWQIHHEPPLHMGGRDDPEFWKPVPITIHSELGRMWDRLKKEILREFSPNERRNIVSDEELHRLGLIGEE